MRIGAPCEYASANRVSLRVATLLLVAACAVAPGTTASAAEVWVVTDREHPIHALHGARLIELDAPARVKAELAAQLPSDPAQASLIARQRLQRGGAQLQQRLANAYQGVIDAWSLGIRKVPAIVIDRRYVIYGETDVARAIARIEDYRRRTEK